MIKVGCTAAQVEDHTLLFLQPAVTVSLEGELGGKEEQRTGPEVPARLSLHSAMCYMRQLVPAEWPCSPNPHVNKIKLFRDIGSGSGKS